MNTKAAEVSPGRQSRVCIVIGAGFSCAYSDAAPTMADFLATAQRLGKYDPSDQHRILADIVARYFGSPIAPDIESLASFLLSDVGSDPMIEQEARNLAYTDLLKIITATLEGLQSRPREGVKDAFRQFAEVVVDNGIQIITFNYDLVLDQLLRDTGKWFPIDGYGVRIPLTSPERYTAADEAAAKEARGIKPEGYLSRSDLLKLHGSLNWGVRRVPTISNPTGVELSIFGALPQSIDLRLQPINQMTHAEFRSAGMPVVSYWQPLIVPPILAKQPQSSGGLLLKNLWYSARWMLSWASEIHVLGYSLPPSDFEADGLLRQGLFGPPPMRTWS